MENYRPISERIKINNNGGGGGGCGCLGFIILVLLLWALWFGLTINGTYYSLSCEGAGTGVNIESTPRRN